MFIPLRLEFAGLLSYHGSAAAPVVVDFQALAEEGIFGIFGPTGAGKTAVLDAICIALFDQSYRVKSERDFVNLNAREAFVRLRYSANGTEWEVYRDWHRTKKDDLKRGDLALFRNGESRLAADKKGELQRQVAESLGGLTLEQFKLAVIIPQNRFAEFLHKTASERAEVLNKLLNLSQYEYASAISELKSKARDEVAAAKASLELLADAIPENLAEREAAHTAACEELTETQQALTAAETALEAQKKAQTLHTEWQTGLKEKQLLEEKASAMQALQQQMAKEEAALRLEAEATALTEKKTAATNAAQALANAQTRTHLAEERHKQAEADSLTARNALAEWNQGQQPRLARLVEFTRTDQSLKTERNALQAKELEWSIAEKAKTEWAAKTQAASEAVAHWRAATQQKTQQIEPLHQQKGAYLELARYAETLQHISRLDAERNSILADYKTKKKQVDDLAAECETLLALAPGSTGVEGLNAAAQQCEQRIETTERELTAIRLQLHVSEQAQQLQPGQPCPLCGSLEHPDPVAPAKELNSRKVMLEKDGAETRAQLISLQNAQARWPDLQNARAAAEADLAQLKERGQSVRGLLDSAKETMADKDPNAITNADTEVKRIEAELQQLNNQIKLAQTQTADAEQHEKQALENLKRAEQKATELAAAIQSQQQRIDQWANELALAGIAPETDFALETQALENQLAQLKAHETATTTTLADAQTEKALAQQGLALANEQLKLAQTAFAEAQASFAKKATASVLGSEENALAYLSGNQRIDLPSAKEQIAAFQTALAVNAQNLVRLEALLQATPFDAEAYQSAANALATAQLQNEHAGQRKGAAESEWQALQKRAEERTRWEAERAKRQALLDNVLELSRLLSGDGFRQFLITTRMQAVCAKANQYLEDFLNGRYLLVPEFINKDFELRVRDRLNADAVRLVNNLSGGETFLVALALALGMASLVQRGQPSFFFLDEGFGNLSPEHLDRVMETLVRLAGQAHGRMAIGLISHVEAVQEWMATYPMLQVQPAQNPAEGSTLVLQ